MSTNKITERVEVQKIIYKLPEINEAEYNKLTIMFVLMASSTNCCDNELALKLLTKEHAMSLLKIPEETYNLLISKLEYYDNNTR